MIYLKIAELVLNNNHSLTIAKFFIYMLKIHMKHIYNEQN